MEQEYKVRLEIFEGPLSLLLHLIQKNQIDITDIPIASITAQYLEYLDFMKRLDVVVAGEYLAMAAYLMQIKSRMLLPKPEPAEAEDDPRLEIVRSLKELVRIREAADFLAARPLLGRDVFVRENSAEEVEKAAALAKIEDHFEVGMVDLIAAFKNVLGENPFPRTLEIAKAKTTLSERLEELEKLLAQKRQIYFFELFEAEERLLIIVTFLAVLELAKQHKVRIIQKKSGSELMIIAHF